jgi:hypothetical protein
MIRGTMLKISIIVMTPLLPPNYYPFNVPLIMEFTGRRPDAGLAFGALFGAGIFVTTVVVGAITVIKPFHPMERPLLRDIIFYLATVAWAYSILYRSRVGLADAVGFIGLYFFYALIVVVGRHLNTFLRRRKSRCLRRSSVVSVLPPVMGSSDDDNEAGGGAHDVSPNGGGWETGLDDSFPPAVTTLEPCNLHGHDLCCHDRPPLLISTGEFHDQGDAKWIVIRGQLRGHNDTPLGSQPTAGLSAARGLGAIRACLVFLVTIN